MRRFVAEGVADDDKNLAVVGFVQARLHMTLIEGVLVRHPVELPVPEQIGGASGVDKGAPGQRLGGYVPGGIHRLDLFAQVFQDIP